MKSVSALVTIGIVLLVSVGGIGCLSQIMQKVQFVVYRSNDRRVVERTFGGVIEMSTARIVEIEATGYESVDAIAEAPGLPGFDDEVNPLF